MFADSRLFRSKETSKADSSSIPVYRRSYNGVSFLRVQQPLPITYKFLDIYTNVSDGIVQKMISRRDLGQTSSRLRRKRPIPTCDNLEAMMQYMNRNKRVNTSEKGRSSASHLAAITSACHSRVLRKLESKKYSTRAKLKKRLCIRSPSKAKERRGLL